MVSELCQPGYHPDSSVVRALALIAKVPGFKTRLDAFHSVGENLYNYDRLSQRMYYFSFKLHMHI